MRTAASALLPLFRSRLQGEVLALVLADPDREWTLDELASRTGSAYQTMANEVRRLQAGDLLAIRTIGRSKLVKANAANPYYQPLAQLVTMSFGAPMVVADEFTPLAGVLQVFIFGSWAARYQGESGPAPHDVDVLLIGTPDRDESYDAAQRAQERLGREVNVTLRSAELWEKAEDAFTRQVRASPLLLIPFPAPSGDSLSALDSSGA